MILILIFNGSVIVCDFGLLRDPGCCFSSDSITGSRGNIKFRVSMLMGLIARWDVDSFAGNMEKG